MSAPSRPPSVQTSTGTAGAPIDAATPTPQQREDVITIFERSVEGRRAAVLPPLDVPERDLAT